MHTVSSESFKRISLYSFWSDWKFLNESIFIYLMVLLNLFLRTVSVWGSCKCRIISYYWMRLLKFKWVATHQSNLYWKKTTSLQKPWMGVYRIIPLRNCYLWNTTRYLGCSCRANLSANVGLLNSINGLTARETRQLAHQALRLQ